MSTIEFGFKAGTRERKEPPAAVITHPAECCSCGNGQRFMRVFTCIDCGQKVKVSEDRV